MPVAIFLGLLIVASFTSVVLFTKKVSGELQAESGTVDPSTGMMTMPRGGVSPVEDGTDKALLENDRKTRENVETALIRTCRTLSTLSHSSNCGDWTSASAIWGFVGAAGSSGSLDALFLTGATSATFSCAPSTREAYGRFLARSAMPAADVIAGGYKYNLQGLDDTNVDPCGYIDIIGK